MGTRNKKKVNNKVENKKFPLPIYDSGDDIYNREKELPFDEMDNSVDRQHSVNANNLPGYNLDIPGSELDDENEAIGEEDEENNYYSLGGENHESLEEDNGDQ